MRVRDVMTPNPITIDPQAPVGTAIAVMRERRPRQLPAVDARTIEPEAPVAPAAVMADARVGSLPLVEGMR